MIKDILALIMVIWDRRIKPKYLNEIRLNRWIFQKHRPQREN